MFERNKIDNSLQQTSVAAELTLNDGRLLKGKFVISAARSIYDVLNGETQFLDFETHEGERTLIAKTSVSAVKIVSLPPAGGLKARLRDGDAFDPHAILGVAASAGWDDVRQAFVKLSKLYHPDIYAGVALPPEVREYLAAMARRINAAYHALEGSQQAAKRVEIEKAKPIFTSSQRA
jgi:hypothetical protein